jgi:sulfoxide reductase heme-binding subunit YedZ
VRTDPTFWIVARASGLTAYALVTCSVLAGLVLKSRPLGKALKPSSVTEVHRYIALLALGATALHGLALVLDTKVEISFPGLLAPGLVSYRPVWTSLGVVAAELMLVVYVSFSLRKRIGTRTWRRLHWSTYALFGAFTLHGLMSGSDSDQPWVLGLYLAAIGTVAFAATWRALVPPVVSRGRTGEQARAAAEA